jgi:Arm DNA-binding domain
MKTNVNQLFYLKKPRNYTSGPIPVYLRLTVNGLRAEVTTGRTCEPGRWNAAAGRATGTREATKVLNAYLETLQVKVHEIQRQLLEAGESISAEKVKQWLTGKVGDGKMLLEIFQEHNRKMKAIPLFPSMNFT